ncbi:hypothetical protein V6N13_108291 [Hibiscus sabdariffa]
MKLAFDLIMKRDALWVRFLRAKYKFLTGVPHVLVQRNVSRFWKGLSVVWKDFYDNIAWILSNGREVDFWNLRIFEHQDGDEQDGVCWSVMARVKAWFQRAAVSYNASRLAQQSVSAQSGGLCRWLAPPPLWLKINPDGAQRVSDGSATCGGVLHDSLGY